MLAFLANSPLLWIMVPIVVGVAAILLLMPLAAWSLSRSIKYWREAQEAPLKRKNDDKPKRYSVGDDGELIEF